MSEYTAKIVWNRGADEAYDDGKYSRGHQWEFDGGEVVPASASPHIVPLPYSVESSVDPEEAFVATLSSCHMLFFLEIASKRRYVIDQYVDDATGLMEEDEAGTMMITKVTLRPAVIFSGGRQPTRQQIEKMHHRAHDLCFIANSVKSAVITEPVFDQE